MTDMKDSLHSFKTHYTVLFKNVSGPVQARPCIYPRGYIELYPVSLTGFQKFFLFCVAGIILEAWDVEFESAHFFAV